MINFKKERIDGSRALDRIWSSTHVKYDVDRCFYIYNTFCRGKKALVFRDPNLPLLKFVNLYNYND